jgi:hypothetical protein
MNSLPSNKKPEFAMMGAMNAMAKIDMVRANYFRAEFEKTLDHLQSRVHITMIALDRRQQGLPSQAEREEDDSIEDLQVILGCLSSQILAIETALERDAMERERNALLSDAQSCVATFDSALKATA